MNGDVVNSVQVHEILHLVTQNRRSCWAQSPRVIVELCFLHWLVPLKYDFIRGTRTFHTSEG